MYNKTSFINETDYAEVSGTRWIMRDLPNYAEGHQLCAKLCARIIQRSLVSSNHTTVLSIGTWCKQSLLFLNEQFTVTLNVP